MEKNIVRTREDFVWDMEKLVSTIGKTKNNLHVKIMLLLSKKGAESTADPFSLELEMKYNTSMLNDVFIQTQRSVYAILEKTYILHDYMIATMDRVWKYPSSPAGWKILIKQMDEKQIVDNVLSYIYPYTKEGWKEGAKKLGVLGKSRKEVYAMELGRYYEYYCTWLDGQGISKTERDQLLHELFPMEKMLKETEYPTTYKDWKFMAELHGIYGKPRKEIKNMRSHRHHILFDKCLVWINEQENSSSLREEFFPILKNYTPINYPTTLEEWKLGAEALKIYGKTYKEIRLTSSHKEMDYYTKCVLWLKKQQNGEMLRNEFFPLQRVKKKTNLMTMEHASQREQKEFLSACLLEEKNISDRDRENLDYWQGQIKQSELEGKWGFEILEDNSSNSAQRKKVYYDCMDYVEAFDREKRCNLINEIFHRKEQIEHFPKTIRGWVSLAKDLNFFGKRLADLKKNMDEQSRQFLINFDCWVSMSPKNDWKMHWEKIFVL